MSYFRGVVGAVSEHARNSIKKNVKDDECFVEGDAYCLVLPQSKKCYCESTNTSVAVMAGVGICSLESSRIEFIKSTSLVGQLQKKNFSSVGGHFAGLYLEGNECTFFVDELGIRELILHQHESHLFFATSEDQLNITLEKPLDIDWRTFSSRWLLSNQISLDSILINSIRLTKGVTASFSLDTYTTIFSDAHNISDECTKLSKDSSDEVESVLQSFIDLPFLDDKNVHMSLSGGMDSRVLLSYLLASGKPFETHTFGDENHPDTRIASVMAKDLHFSHTVIDTPITSDDSLLITQLSKYSLNKKVTTNATSFQAFRYYDELTGMKDAFIIDGGFGEIGRRRIFERMRVLNKKALLSRDPSLIYPLLKRNRADIFNSEFSKFLEVNAKEQLSQYIEKAPDINSIGIDRWLDLFALNTMIPNYIGVEQSRLDTLIDGYMPFGQKLFIEHMLECPISLRRNARLYRKIINNKYPALRKYPFVRFGITYPYGFGAIVSYLCSKIKSTLGKTFVSADQITLLKRLEPFVRDTVSSKFARELSIYDHKKINTLVDGFYSGLYQKANELDWWLSFELWRQNLSQRD